MKLKQSIVKQGYFLFRYRSYFPIILFVLSVPFVYESLKWADSSTLKNILNILAALFWLMGFLIRGYTIGTTPKGTSGRNTKEQVAEQLNTKGIYSMVRHPLYLGNFLMWLGIVIFTYSLNFIIIFILLFYIYYERIMAAEEDYIEGKFGEQFDKWSIKTPAFFPKFKNYEKTNINFSLKSVLRREYSGCLATVISFTYIDYLRYYFKTNSLISFRLSFYILILTIIITLVLRTLKHNTSFLNEANRS